MEVISTPASTRTQAPLNPSREVPPIIFIHGSLHGAWCFRLFQHYFAKSGFHTYALSLRGAGNTKSDRTLAPTVEQHLEDLTAFVDQLNSPKPPIIVAHSIGGFVVQKWAESALSEFSGIVLLASTPPSGNSSMVRRIFIRDGIWRTIRITMGFVRRGVTKDISLCRDLFFSPEEDPDFCDDVEGDDVLQEYMKLQSLTKVVLDPKSLKNIVRSTGALSAPVFVVGAANDALIDLDSFKEAAEFWKADLCIMPKGPHNLMLYSKWEEVASLILRWIEKKVMQRSSG